LVVEDGEVREATFAQLAHPNWITQKTRGVIIILVGSPFMKDHILIDIQLSKN